MNYMKLLQVGDSHNRNSEFIIRACQLFNIEYHRTNSTEFPDNGYDIIWCPGVWINPDRYPTSKFIFGPQFWVFPDPKHAIFTQSKPEHRNRCIYVCLSDWIIHVWNEFIDTTKTNIPFVPIPFGLEYIQPKAADTDYTYDCIIYLKARHPSLLNHCESVVKARGLRYKVYRYGSYQRQEYIETLKKTRFAIWIGSHESQGFGFQECLATGTPIYVYDVKSMKDEFTGRYGYAHHSEQLLATTAPYWSDKCGLKVYSNEEFVSRFDEFLVAIPTYDSAAYVKAQLSDSVCFQRFLDALSITLPSAP
jgi:hypothetical protein